MRDMRLDRADLGSLPRNMMALHQLGVLCEGCVAKERDYKCGSCGRWFCEACTPVHLAEEERRRKTRLLEDTRIKLDVL